MYMSDVETDNIALILINWIINEFILVFLTNERKDFRQWFKTKRHIHPWYFNLYLYEVYKYINEPSDACFSWFVLVCNPVDIVSLLTD